ncbi:cytochrome C oxidase subunit IV family protein [Sedimentitalea sp. XS_ASV28]|uniref:cytochrome C oxidase subunit IV family protein n=1 Tax=Sedimentitalea sp. XS_ASV28 TaxID=3241296 RepID=UPI003511B8FD
MNFSRPLLIAWGTLIGLSLLAALVTLSPLPRWAGAGLVLLLALFKARLILARYLDLQGAPGWLAGATLAFTLWALLAYALYLLPFIVT